MLQFTWTKLTERVKAKCSRHPRYNPEKMAAPAIKGGCSSPCFSLYDLHQARVTLECSAAESLIRRAAPWAQLRREARRKRKRHG